MFQSQQLHFFSFLFRNYRNAGTTPSVLFGIILAHLRLISSWKKCWNQRLSPPWFLLLALTISMYTLYSLLHTNDTQSSVILRWILSSVVFVFISWETGNIHGWSIFSSENHECGIYLRCVEPIRLQNSRTLLDNIKAPVMHTFSLYDFKIGSDIKKVFTG